MTEPRYFIDQRIGAIAIRDRTKLSQVLFEGEEPVEEGPGLHPDMRSIIWYRPGHLTQDKPCPTCHHITGSRRRYQGSNKSMRDAQYKLTNPHHMPQFP